MNVQKINLNRKLRQYNSKDSRGFNRVSSLNNILSQENPKSIIFPSVNNNNNSMIIIRRKSLNNSLGKKNHYKIEIEKLYDQNVHYKKTIKKLQSEINEIKSELNKKQQVLCSVNNEIEKLIKENKDDTDFTIEQKDEQWNDQGKYSLIKKMKNKIKEAQNGLNEQILKNKNLKKNRKFTKFNELEIEKKIINDQINKIQLLIENSLEMKSNHDKELYRNDIFNTGLESQKNIIQNFMKKFEDLTEEEKFLQNEIDKYEKILNKTSNRVKIVKLKQLSLQDQNKKLVKEKEDFINKNKSNDNFDNIFLLDNLKRKLSSAKNDYNYNRLKNEKTNEKLNNIKKKFNENVEQYKRIEHKNPLQEENNKSVDNNINKENSEEYIKKLKEIYQENRDKENELEKYLFLYQEAIQKMNNGENVNIEDIRSNILKIISKVNINNKGNSMNSDFVLSENNPYYSNDEGNEPLINNKFSNEQYGQFTYILFKNFEAKKIDYEKAQKDIISPFIDYYNNNKDETNENEIQEKLSSKFAEIILKVLNCNNEFDKTLLKLYFNALYCEPMISSDESNDNNNKIDLITQYFLSLFNYIHIYDESEETDMKKRLKLTLNSQLVKLKDLLKDYISKNNQNKNNEDYISIKEIKNILNNNADINIKENYIEFIIYYMKQFNDANASLLDLNVGKLENILAEQLDNDEQKSDNIPNNELESNNDSKEEVSPPVFNKNIHDVLLLIKQLMTKENKNLRDIFADSIVKITKPNADIITLDSLVDELNKKNVKLNYLQMSCFNYNYCINDELHALDIDKIEKDINNLKEDEIYQYHESVKK